MAFEILECHFCHNKGQGPDVECTVESESESEFINRNMWVLGFWTRDEQGNEHYNCKDVCPSCAGRLLRQDGADYLLVADFGGEPGYNLE